MNNNRIQVKTVENKEEWESFLLSQNLPPFLQSWNAGEQSLALGESILRLGMYQGQKLLGICLLLKVSAKRGRYLFAPYGPVLSEWSDEIFKTFLDAVKTIASNEGFDFIRIAPYVENTTQYKSLFAKNGFRLSPIHMLSEIVWTLDLQEKTEEELLMGMRKTTRNLIRRAQKDGVTVEKSTEKRDLENFLQLMVETQQRHHFVPYADNLYHEQVEAFKHDDQVLIFSASFQNQLIASAIIMFYGNAASYHHGASTPSKIPAAYLLQWEAILEAKRRGCKEYSFWGIDDSDNPKHPFYGITKFKKGFGGSVRYLLPAHDLVLSQKYWINYLVETVRRIKRGFGLRRSSFEKNK